MLSRILAILSGIAIGSPVMAQVPGAADTPYAPMSIDADATAALQKGKLDQSRPYLVVNDSVYAIPQSCWPRAFGGGDVGRAFGGASDGRAMGGSDAGRAFGGDTAGRAFGGDQAGRRLGGDEAGRGFGGNETGRAFGGDANGRAFSGDKTGRNFGGQSDGRAFGGDQTTRAFGGTDAGRAFGGGEAALGCRLGSSGASIEFTPARDGVVRSGRAMIEVRNGIIWF